MKEEKEGMGEGERRDKNLERKKRKGDKRKER